MKIAKSKGDMFNLIMFIYDIIILLFSYVMAGVLWVFAYKKICDWSYVDDVLNTTVGEMLFCYAIMVFFFSVNHKFIKRGKFAELKHVIKLNVLFAGIYGMVLFLDGGKADVPRGVYVFTIVVNIVAMYIGHLLLKLYLVKVHKKSAKSEKLIIITTSEKIEQTLKSLKNKYEWHVSLDGIILTDVSRIDEQIEGITVVGDRNSICEYCRTQIVDKVLINLGTDDEEHLTELIKTIQEMGAEVQLAVAKLNDFAEYNMKLDMVGNIPVVTFANVFHDGNKLLVKRLIDIVGALVGIVITIVVSIFVVPILCIESPGNPIFKQKRVGKNGRFFNIYKFRSMYKDAEERKKELMAKNEMNGLMFKMKDDPRITKVGKFIRKTSIDELPQFFNVLKGDMSLVGTRPPTVDEFKRYEGHHKRRLSMKPGITGLWQVSGRSDINEFEEVVKLDLEYIDNWSLGLDVKIIVKTLGVIFFGRGAR